MELEPDYLKIDGSLVKNLQSDKKSFAMVKSITHFGHELGIKVIAEYVANKEIFEILLSIGVDEFQGFYFGKPEVFT
jgi:EAL domain-containing protein (putative c-di-GMP-specific phosphodiesterase class I)